jgi:hypothetical protein
MTVNARSIAALAIASLSLACACGSDPETVSSSYMYVSGTGGTTISGGGITVEVGSSVKFNKRMLIETGKPNVDEARINGMLFELIEHGFRLGDHSFDGLQAGDIVLIEADGIQVNGEQRWDLPTD